jgi:hypothetical protein
MTGLYTIVYSRGVDERYRFDERSYEALAAAGIRWQDVLDILQTRPRIRQHIGALLRIAAQTSDGRWFAVICIEDDDDDEYLVVSARALDETEIPAVRAMIEGDMR